MRCFLDGPSIFQWGETIAKINQKNKPRYMNYRLLVDFLRKEFKCKTFEGVFTVDKNIASTFTAAISGFGIDITEIDHRITGAEVAVISSKIASMRNRDFVLVSSNPAFVPLMAKNGTMIGPTFGCSPLMNLLSNDIDYQCVDKEIEVMF